MKKYRKWSTIFIIVSIFFVVFFQSVVYSAFSSSFDIDGKAYARLATDVRITGIKVSEKYSSSNFISNYETYSRDSITVSIDFKDTGTVYYEVEVTNYNNSDVQFIGFYGLPEGLSITVEDVDLSTPLISGIGKTTITLVFSGTGSFEFDFILYFASVYNITYEGFDGSNYPTVAYDTGENVIDFGDEKVGNVSMTVAGEEYTDFTLEDNILTFGPVSGDVVITNESTIRVISGNLDTVGSEVCIDTECFYVISSDDTKIIMLAKYNLYVGNKCITSTSSTCTEFGAEATGIQHSTMVGYGVDPRMGVNVFSSTNYWYSGGLKSSYGTAYPAYVYDKNSLLYSYVDNYKKYLENSGIIIEEARLIKVEELEKINCIRGTDCKSAPEWVYATSYWTGEAYTSQDIWIVNKNGFDFDRYYAKAAYGVRPVIVISRSEM